MTDHHTAMLNAALDAAREMIEEPKDGYGPGYLVYSIAADFHALCCQIGPEAARQEMAEIINTEFERKTRL